MLSAADNLEVSERETILRELSSLVDELRRMENHDSDATSIASGSPGMWQRVFDRLCHVELMGSAFAQGTSSMTHGSDVPDTVARALGGVAVVRSVVQLVALAYRGMNVVKGAARLRAAIPGFFLRVSLYAKFCLCAIVVVL